jgi:hypothetical protein
MTRPLPREGGGRVNPESNLVMESSSTVGSYDATVTALMTYLWANTPIPIGVEIGICIRALSNAVRYVRK